MNDLIDMVLETVLRSVIWRSTWHMPLTVLICLGVVVFIILAYRRRGGKRHYRKSKTKRRYKSRFWDK